MTKKKIPKLPEVAPIDIWTMLLSTVRYSMGRQTYMSSLAWELVVKYNSYLQNHQIEQIIREIESEFTLEKQYTGHMGHKCDVNSWNEGVLELKNVLRKRDSTKLKTPTGIFHYKMTDFSETPGGRYAKQGTFSGEEFRKNILLPALKEYDKIELNLDGTYGYPIVFLRGAFVDLLQDYPIDEIKNRLSFISNEDSSLPKRIQEMVLEHRDVTNKNS